MNLTWTRGRLSTAKIELEQGKIQSALGFLLEAVQELVKQIDTGKNE